MTIRFRLSDQAFLQQQTLQVPMSLLEHLVQPAWRGSSVLLSARVLQCLPAELRLIARRFVGLYLVADGQGTITQISKMAHRLSVAEQDTEFAIAARQHGAPSCTAGQEIFAVCAAS